MALGKMGRRRPAAQALVDRVADDVWFAGSGAYTLPDERRAMAQDNSPYGSKDAAPGGAEERGTGARRGVLLQAAKSQTSTVKAWALRRLGELSPQEGGGRDGGDAPAPRERRAPRKGGNPAARSPAAKALGEKKPGDARASAVVRAMSEQLKGDDAVARREAAVALGKMGRRRPPGRTGAGGPRRRRRLVRRLRSVHAPG